MCLYPLGSLAQVSNYYFPGTMPLNLLLYSQFISDDPSFKPSDIPYLNLLLSLVIIAVPVAVGMLLAAKAKKATVQLTKFGKPVVLLLLMIYIAIGKYLETNFNQHLLR